LYRADLVLDLLGRLGGLGGEILHLTRYHGEALARITRARRFDRGVEREQVGLCGDIVDQAYDLADPVG
jgi:hypothetical protein